MSDKEGQTIWVSPFFRFRIMKNKESNFLFKKSLLDEVMVKLEYVLNSSPKWLLIQLMGI